MNIKIISHFMAWEIDYALLTFTQLKKSKYYLPDDVNITVETVLNLSNYIFDWDKSSISKKFFIDKYNQLSYLLKDYNHISKIYDGDELYGYFELQKEAISSETDYYLTLCPDIYFSEKLLAYMIEGSRHIHNKYFTLVPQVHKVGDSDWDRITDPKYMNIPYESYLNTDIFDIIHNNTNSEEEIVIDPISPSKWAGFFDLQNKAFYEELCPPQDDWVGYGPWDYYSQIITNHVVKHGVDFQQYVLRGETVWMYPVGSLLGEDVNGFIKYYKDNIAFKTQENKFSQREKFESKMQDYLQKGIQQLKDKGILNG